MLTTYMQTQQELERGVGIFHAARPGEYIFCRDAQQACPPLTARRLPDACRMRNATPQKCDATA